MPENPAGLRPPGWEETAAACPAFRSGDFVCPSFAHDRSATAENLSVYALRTSNRSAAEAFLSPSLTAYRSTRLKRLSADLQPAY